MSSLLRRNRLAGSASYLLAPSLGPLPPLARDRPPFERAGRDDSEAYAVRRFHDHRRAVLPGRSISDEAFGMLPRLAEANCGAPSTHGLRRLYHTKRRWEGLVRNFTGSFFQGRTTLPIRTS